MHEGSKIRSWHLVLLALLTVLTLVTARGAGARDGLLRVYFLDVGQGDAIFIQAPNGNQILVDGGPNGDVLGELGKIMLPSDRDIDAVIVSHPHADHIAGLIEVLKRYDVHTIVQAHETYRSPEFTAWQSAVTQEKAQEVEALAGTQLDLGNGAVMTVLYPFRSWQGEETTQPHQANVVVLLQYGTARFLLTGDLEAKAEQELIARGVDVDADVLKVGHHGSKTSTTESFLNAVTPQVAFIEVGANNRYKLPSPLVLERLEQFGIPYYRTDTEGTLEVVSDGPVLMVRPF